MSFSYRYRYHIAFIVVLLVTGFIACTYGMQVTDSVNNQDVETSTQTKSEIATGVAKIDSVSTFTNQAGRYIVTVPEGWNATAGLVSTSSTLLRASGKLASQEDEYVADISITARSNERNLNFTEFYNLVEDGNLYALSSTQTSFQINGLDAVRFNDVPGMLPSTIVTIKLGNRMFEIIDYDNAHQSDGAFDLIVSSFHPIF